MAAFIDFWGVYPKRKDKLAAQRAWAKALKNGADPDEIINAAGRYADDKTRDPLYTKLPATWLNAGSWMDEASPLSRLEDFREQVDLALRFVSEPEGITFKEFLDNYATEEEKEIARKTKLSLGIK